MRGERREGGGKHGIPTSVHKAVARKNTVISNAWAVVIELVVLAELQRSQNWHKLGGRVNEANFNVSKVIITSPKAKKKNQQQHGD